MTGLCEGFPLVFHARCQLLTTAGTEVLDDDLLVDMLQVIKRYVLAKLFAEVFDSRR